MQLDGKSCEPVDGINGGEIELPVACNSALSLRTLAANHLPLSMLASNVSHSLCSRSHVSQGHRVYCSVLSPCTLSTRNQDRRRPRLKPLEIEAKCSPFTAFPLGLLRISDFVCLSLEGGLKFMTSLVHNAICRLLLPRNPESSFDSAFIALETT